MVNHIFDGAYCGRRVLVTGHTGFKGSWLALWLDMLGAKVAGLALPAETVPNHWSLLKLDIDSRHADITDAARLKDHIRDIRPEIVFHLAAQSLVRRSYQQPLETWTTNVLGTANVLDACRDAGVRAIVAVTTDKCYENNEWHWGYREIDALGGHDPYSASKAGSELVAASYRRAFFATEQAPLLATARAGNVVGGGDWSQDRLLSDLVRAVAAGTSLEVRAPRATRPWQHVLECLSGYLVLGQSLLAGNRWAAEPWNFGPDREGNRRVEDVLAATKACWPAVQWHVGTAPQLHEAQLLQLDSSKARAKLGWHPVWSFDEGIAATSEWYRAWLETGKILSPAQIDGYVDAARSKNLAWTATTASRPR